jgi:hypothetical protein
MHVPVTGDLELPRLAILSCSDEERASYSRCRARTRAEQMPVSAGMKTDERNGEAVLRGEALRLAVRLVQRSVDPTQGRFDWG